MSGLEKAMLVALSVQALEGPRLIEAHRVAVAEAAQEMESLLSQSPVLNEDESNVCSDCFGPDRIEICFARHPQFPSDAYTTGQTNVRSKPGWYSSLRSSGLSQRCRLLQTTQLQGGSWHVRSRSVNFNHTSRAASRMTQSMDLRRRFRLGGHGSD